MISLEGERRFTCQETRPNALSNNMMRIFRIFREYLEKDNVGLEFDLKEAGITIFELHITSSDLRRKIYSETISLYEREVYVFFRELYKKNKKIFPIDQIPE